MVQHEWITFLGREGLKVHNVGFCNSSQRIYIHGVYWREFSRQLEVWTFQLFYAPGYTTHFQTVALVTV